MLLTPAAAVAAGVVRALLGGLPGRPAGLKLGRQPQVSLCNIDHPHFLSRREALAPKSMCGPRGCTTPVASAILQMPGFQ